MVCQRPSSSLDLGPRSLTLPDLPVTTTPPPTMDMLYVVLVLTITDPAKDLGEYFHAACTGTLITRSLVVTSTRCVLIDAYEDYPNPAGTRVYQRPNLLTRAVKIYLYPDKTQVIDLLLIKVEDAVGEFFPRFAEDSRKFSNNDLKSCVLAGYGSQGEPSVDHFNIIDLNRTKADLIACRPGSSQAVCIHFEDVMPCGGDMGSALVCDDTLMAVFTPRRDPGSYRDNCVNRYGAVFSPLSSVSPWFKAILAAPDPGLDWINNPWYILLLSITVLTITGLIYYSLVELLQHKFHKQSADEVNSVALSASVLLQIDDPPNLAPAVAETVSATTVGSSAWTRLWR